MIQGHVDQIGQCIHVETMDGVGNTQSNIKSETLREKDQ